MLPLNVKKMITREVELQQMRRSETVSANKRTGAVAASNKLPEAETSAFVLPELSGTPHGFLYARMDLGLTFRTCGSLCASVI